MGSLTAVLSSLILSGTIFSLLPDGPNTIGLDEGELFLPPLAGDYNNGFSISNYQSSNNLYKGDNVGFLDLGKSFSIRRWYFDDNKILEVGGAVRFKTYFSDSYRDAGVKLLRLGNDYKISNHVGFLMNSLVFRLNWNYERKESSREFVDYIDDATSSASAAERALFDNREHILEGDNFEFLVADVRSRLRYYIAVGTYSRINDDVGKKFARYGFDYRGSAPGKAPRLIVGGEQTSYEYNGWDSTYKLAVGVEKSESPIRGWRITANWQEGASSYGPFRNNKERLVGIKTSFVF